MKEIRSNRILIILLGIILLAGISAISFAQVPQTTNYQGFLTDLAGDPVNDTVDMTFRIYDSADPLVVPVGSESWSETHISVLVTQGVYSVVLGSAGSPLTLDFNTQYWLGIEVGTDGEMDPRQALTSVPYALNADRVDNMDAVDLLDKATYDSDNNANVDSAESADTVVVPLTIYGARNNGGLFTITNSDTSGIGVFGQATGIGGSGLYGNASGSSGRGVYGRSSSSNGIGVYGVNTNGGTAGHFDSSAAGGIAGYFNSPAGYGIIVETGNVGIGTGNPAYNLDVAGTINASTAIKINGVDVLTSYSETDPQVGSNALNYVPKWNGSTLMQGTIFDNGNIGIGTITPAERLTVAGTIQLTSGGVMFPDGSVQTSAVYGKVAVVAQSGGQYTSPLDAMTDISSWCGTPSSTNPCLVKIMPGIYDLGNNGLAMQSYVDIEGSGEHTTTITSTHSSIFFASSATVSGADNAEIRFLTVEHQGGGTYAFAILNDTASPDITNVTVTATGGDHNYCMRNDTSSPTMTNVTAIASGGISSIGVQNVSSSPAMTNVTATASGGGTSNSGVWNYASSPTMTNVTATATGGNNSYGVYNNSNSSPAMTNVTATASGGTGNYGVYNFASSPLIKTSSISGTTNSINNLSSSTARVATTMLNGVVAGGSFTCVGAYDQNFTALGTNCL